MSVGETPSACATAGPIAGTTSTPIETSAWIASVMASTRQVPESAGAAVEVVDTLHPSLPAALHAGRARTIGRHEYPGTARCADPCDAPCRRAHPGRLHPPLARGG